MMSDDPKFLLVVSLMVSVAAQAQRVAEFADYMQTKGAAHHQYAASNL